MEAFVKQTELDYELADSPHENGSKRFMCTDTFRHIFDGYFCRTDFDANRPCPTCPILVDPKTGECYSDCKNLTADGQRIRIRKEELGRAPNKPRDGAPSVDCKHYYQACERLAWPPGGPSKPNGKARVIFAEVCELLLKAGSPMPDGSLVTRVQDLKELLRSEVLTGYLPAINLVLAAFERRVRQEGLALSAFETALTTTMASVCHSQTEATQFIPVGTHTFLNEILHLSSTTGFASKDKSKWTANPGIRRSLIALAWAGKIAITASGVQGGDATVRASLFKLRPEIDALFRTLDVRVKNIQDFASQSMHQRTFFPHDKRPGYDPSCGEAYFFSSSGRPLASWPNFDNVKSESPCEKCDHPDWYRTGRHSMSEGIMTLACLRSYTIRGFHFMLGHEAKADAAGGIYSYAKNSPDTVILDTPCQHAPYVNSRVGFFYLTQFVCDRFHGLKHACRRIFAANEFGHFDAVNTSFIEQYHSVQKILKSMVAGATREHATFYVSLLIDHHYNGQCDSLNIPEIRRRWPPCVSSDPPGPGTGPSPSPRPPSGPINLVEDDDDSSDGDLSDCDGAPWSSKAAVGTSNDGSTTAKTKPQLTKAKAAEAAATASRVRAQVKFSLFDRFSLPRPDLTSAEVFDVSRFSNFKMSMRVVDYLCDGHLSLPLVQWARRIGFEVVFTTDRNQWGTSCGCVAAEVSSLLARDMRPDQPLGFMETDTSNAASWEVSEAAYDWLTNRGMSGCIDYCPSYFPRGNSRTGQHVEVRAPGQRSGKMLWTPYLTDEEVFYLLERRLRNGFGDRRVDATNEVARQAYLRITVLTDTDIGALPKLSIQTAFSSFLGSISLDSIRVIVLRKAIYGSPLASGTQLTFVITCMVPSEAATKATEQFRQTGEGGLHVNGAYLIICDIRTGSKIFIEPFVSRIQDPTIHPLQVEYPNTFTQTFEKICMDLDSCREKRAPGQSKNRVIVSNTSDNDGLHWFSIAYRIEVLPPGGARLGRASGVTMAN